MPLDKNQPPTPPPIEPDPLKFLREAVSEPSLVRDELRNVSLWRDVVQPFVWSLFVAVEWAWTHRFATAIVGGLFVWAMTSGGQRGTWWPALNYLSLGVAVFAAMWLVATRCTGSRTRVKLACAAAVFFAWYEWSHFDTFAVRKEGEFATTYTQVRRFGGEYWRREHLNESTDGSHLGTFEGPVDSRGYRHGKWHLAFSGDRGPGEDQWFYHDKQVSAVEYQAMIAD